MKLANLVRCFCLVILLACGLKCEEEYCDAADASCNIDHIQEKVRNKMIVAAIDFGTTYSGWAYQTKHQYRKDPTVIETSEWTHSDILSKKTPTTVLIKPDGLTLEAFGYEAEKRYLTLAEKEEHEKYFYFKRFKMMLYDKKNLNTETKLVDDKGLELPAITVFSLAIGFLKNHLMDDLKKMDQAWTMDDIHWVLTVPAIWNDMAKQFMRKSAVAAGILTEDLTIALEPEAASLYCRLLPVEKQVDDTGAAFLNSFQPGRKYMVLDAGGGTADITVHEVVSDKLVKEIHKASGGPWGGTQVDKAFEEMLRTIIGDDVFEKFQTNCAYEHLDLFRSFEIIKRSVKQSYFDNISLYIPMCLVETLKQMTGQGMSDKVAASIYKDKIWMRWDKISLSADLMRDLFKNTVDSIVAEIKTLFLKENVREAGTVLMVGGFSDSPLLQEAIKSAFSDSKKLIIPKDAGLAIVKGAVIYGYFPSAIVEKIVPRTYGIETTTDFIVGKHKHEKKKHVEGRDVCMGLFHRHIAKDTSLKYGEVFKHTYVPLYENQTELDIDIYACLQDSPMYVTDADCENVGSITIEVSDRTVPRRMRRFPVEFILYASEVHVIVTESRSNTKKELYLDFPPYT